MVCACILDEVVGVVGVVAINKEQSALTVCFSAGLVIKLLDPFNTDFAINVSLFLVPKSMCVLANHYCNTEKLTRHLRDSPASSLPDNPRL